MPVFRDTAAGAVAMVRVTPRAARTAIEGVRDDTLLVRLTAAPVDDAANEALVELLSTALGVPKRDVRIASGGRSRTKRILVARPAAMLNARLAPAR